VVFGSGYSVVSFIEKKICFLRAKNIKRPTKEKAVLNPGLGFPQNIF
jgi:hypothetical protein